MRKQALREGKGKGLLQGGKNQKREINFFSTLPAPFRWSYKRHDDKESAALQNPEKASRQSKKVLITAEKGHEEV
jgi:hypothetical protein